MSDVSKAAAGPPRPSLLMGSAHLAALWALAILQPMLSLLGDNPDFFVARGNTGTEIVIFTVAFALLPPLIALGMEVVANLLSSKLRWVIHLSLVGLLASVIVLRTLKTVADGPAAPLILGSLVLGAALACAYGYSRFMRSLTDFLIPAPVIVLAVFLFFSSTSALITRSPGEAVAFDVRISNPAPVVVVTFDEFPEGSLLTPERKVNPRRFPHFAELEREGTWFRNTVTSASFTSQAVPPILTGRLPDVGDLATAADAPDSIFTLLGGAYKVNAVETASNLCPDAICGSDDGESVWSALSNLAEDLKYVEAHLVLPGSMSSNLPDVSQSFEDFGGSGAVPSPEEQEKALEDFKEAVKSALEGEGFDVGGDLTNYLDGYEPGTEKTLNYIHIGKPHYPWTHYPDGQSYTRDENEFRPLFNLDEWLDDGYPTERARQAHLLEVGYTDHLLGLIMDQVKAVGNWNRSLVVVTADHGGAMTKGFHRREARPQTMGQIAMVPLFVKAPGQKKSRVVNRTTCTTEVLAIIGRILGVRVPWKSPPCNQREVTVENLSGPPVSSPIRTMTRQRDEYVETLASLFGGDTGWAGVFHLGPNAGLIGRSIGSLAIDGPDAGAAATPEDPVAASTEFDAELPVNLVLRQKGALEGVPAGAALAVSVNGRIAAVGRAYPQDGQMLYSMLIPESSLRSGTNEIAIFRDRKGPQGISLTRLWSSSDQ